MNTQTVATPVIGQTLTATPNPKLVLDLIALQVGLKQNNKGTGATTHLWEKCSLVEVAGGLELHFQDATALEICKLGNTTHLVKFMWSGFVQNLAQKRKSGSNLTDLFAHITAGVEQGHEFLTLTHTAEGVNDVTLLKEFRTDLDLMELTQVSKVSTNKTSVKYKLAYSDADLFTAKERSSHVAVLQSLGFTGIQRVTDPETEEFSHFIVFLTTETEVA